MMFLGVANYFAHSLMCDQTFGVNHRHIYTAYASFLKSRSACFQVKTISADQTLSTRKMTGGSTETHTHNYKSLWEFLQLQLLA